MSVGVLVGASGGIGQACAKVMAGSVERLILVARNRRRLAEVVAELGSSAIPVEADIATARGRGSIVRAVDPEDALKWVVIASGVPLRGALPSLAEDDIEATVAANLVGPILLLRALTGVPWETGAAVVIIGSVSASRALPERSVYAATKAGIEHFAAALAAEWAPRGIRVNIVAPGIIGTSFLGAEGDRLDRWAADRVPVARLGEPDEVARVVRYLALEAPAYVVGARIVVDGGTEARA